MEFIISKYNYWIYIILMMIGFYAMIGKRNLVKKIVGLNIFQTSIILYFVSIGAKKGATIPIVFHGHGGLDELTTTGPNRVSRLQEGLVTTEILDPADLGFARARPEALLGGTPDGGAGHD